MRDAQNDIVLREYRKSGWDSVIVQSHFMTEQLIDELLTEAHETSIEAFAEWQKASANG